MGLPHALELGTQASTKWDSEKWDCAGQPRGAPVPRPSEQAARRWPPGDSPRLVFSDTRGSLGFTSQRPSQGLSPQVC